MVELKKVLELKEGFRKIFGDNFDYTEIDNKIKELEEDSWNLYSQRIKYGGEFNEDYEQYYYDDVIKLKAKILDDIEENMWTDAFNINKKFIDIPEIKDILDKRFGF